MNKRAIYTVITTFFFIILVIAAVLVMVNYSTFLTMFSKNVDSDTEKYLYAKTFKESVYYCFGRVLKSNLLDNNTCLLSTQNKTVNFDFNPEIIKGYRIKRLDTNNCTSTIWQSNISEIQGQYSDILVYSVPILHEDMQQVCLGKMEIYV